MDKVLASTLNQGDCIKFGFDGSVYSVVDSTPSGRHRVNVWCLHEEDRGHHGGFVGTNEQVYQLSQSEIEEHRNHGGGRIEKK